MKHRFKSLEEIGLQKYLDETADKHNGKTYADFVRMLTGPDEFGDPIPKSKIARMFGVSRPTIERWIEVYTDNLDKPQAS